MIEALPPGGLDSTAMVMVSLFICNSNLLPKPPPLRLLQVSNPFPPPSTPNSSSLLHFHRRKKTRGLSLVTRAGGAPGTSTYIFAFFLPLSLLAITVFTSIRIADKLDRDFLEEMAVNQAIMEEEEEDGEAGIMPLEEKPLPRTRNRPKREAETSSM